MLAQSTKAYVTNKCNNSTPTYLLYIAVVASFIYGSWSTQIIFERVMTKSRPKENEQRAQNRKWLKWTHAQTFCWSVKTGDCPFHFSMYSSLKNWNYVKAETGLQHQNAKIPLEHSTAHIQHILVFEKLYWSPIIYSRCSSNYNHNIRIFLLPFSP